MNNVKSVWFFLQENYGTLKALYYSNGLYHITHMGPLAMASYWLNVLNIKKYTIAQKFTTQLSHGSWKIVEALALHTIAII